MNEFNKVDAEYMERLSTFTLGYIRNTLDLVDGAIYVLIDNKTKRTAYYTSEVEDRRGNIILEEILKSINDGTVGIDMLEGRVIAGTDNTLFTYFEPLHYAGSEVGLFKLTFGYRLNEEQQQWMKRAANIFAYVIGVTEEKQEKENELRNIREETESSGRFKQNFLANMSHELRTPLNSIIGMANLMMNTNLNYRQRDYMEKINMSSKHLLGVLNSILDFSKIESGNTVVEKSRFSLESVLSNAIGVVIEKAQSKQLEIILDVERNIPDTYLGDSVKIGQILVNYLNNAVKFTDYGEIIISVKSIIKRNKQCELHFSVKDTGIGLSSEQQDKLFKSFVKWTPL